MPGSRGCGRACQALHNPQKSIQEGPMGYASAIQVASQLGMDALMAYLVDHTLLGTRIK